MATNSKKENGSLRFFRGEGCGWSVTSTGYAKELKDVGAEIRFRDRGQTLNIYFEYYGPKGNVLKRDLNLDIHQVIQLRDFLNDILNKQAMEGKYFYVFSYGSNMLLDRIKDRVDSVEVVDKHELKGFKLIFNKKCNDGSRKANIEETKDIEDSVWGVIHKIDLADKPILDKFEALGKGYQLTNFMLTIEEDYRLIHYYVATEYRYLEIGKPYDCYLNLVIAGAKENGFPNEYIEQLKSIESKIDMDVKRREKNE